VAADAFSQPKRRHVRLSVAIPASIVSDVPHLREKTLRIGFIGRALAIFRVEEVIIYPDIPNVDQKRDASIISEILSYMETPQYLRRRLFKIRPELRFVGILPPLRTPHHPTRRKEKELRSGEYREGIVVSSDERGAMVDIGIERPILIPKALLQRNLRVTVKVKRKGKIFIGELSDPNQIKTYWGYEVRISKSPLGRILKEGKYDLTIATSRLGKPITEVLNEISDLWGKSKRALIAFGSPTRGLKEILKDENISLENAFHFIINTIPNQGVKTVRTEEAIYATLSLMNFLFPD